MHTLLYTLIILFGSASYIAGIWQIIRGEYRPNIYSRIVWLLLAINSLAGVVISKSTKASILLATIFLIGNICICLLSFWRGTFTLGRLEYICTFLLIISGAVWVFFNAPLLNLIIGLAAHFIGAQPTYRRVWQDGSSESTAFWSLFFIASLLSIFVGNGSSLKNVIFPIYFTLFDGSMTVLSLRRKPAK